MFVLKRVGVPGGAIAYLQEVRLREVDTPGVQFVCVLLFIGLTHNEVHMVQSDGAVISQRVLDQCIRIGASALGEFLIALVEVYTVALNPCRYPGLVLGVGLAV